MARVKMHGLVRWPNGQVATPRQMLDNGLAEVRIVEKFQATSKGKPRRAVFVDLKGTCCGVEVSGFVQTKEYNRPCAVMEKV